MLNVRKSPSAWAGAKLLLFFGFHVLHGEIFYIFDVEVCILRLYVQIFESEVAKMILVFLLLHVEEHVAVEGDVPHGDVVAV